MITSTSDYQSWYNKILAGQIATMKVQSLVGTNIEQESYITINANTREITIPSNLRKIGVIKDQNAETVYFQISRYFDNQDLAANNVSCIVQYVNAKNDSAWVVINSAYTMQEGSKDYLIIPWTIGGNATAVKGSLTFALRFFIVSEDNEITYSFNTQTGVFTILDGLDIKEENATEGLSASQFEKLIQDATEASNKLEALVSNNNLDNFATKEDLVNIKIAVDDSLDDKSTNPLQNKVINSELTLIKEQITGINEDAETIQNNIKDIQTSISEIPIVIVDEELSKDSTNPVQSKTIYEALNNITIAVDDNLNNTSENPVQNKVVDIAINSLQTSIDDINNRLSELTYVPIIINEFICTPDVAEEGIETQVTLTWEVSKAAAAQTINEEDVAGINKQYTVSESTDYVLKVTDNQGQTASAKTSITFVKPVYYGAVEASEYDDTFIKSLTKYLTKESNYDLTIDAGANEYIYFCAPAEDTYDFYSSGFSGALVLAASTSEYKIYKSVNANLGNTKIQVIKGVS